MNAKAQGIATARKSVIWLYEHGRYQEALASAIEVVGRSRDYYSEAHPELAASLNILAMIYHALGQFESALPLHQEALKIRRKCYGLRSPEVAVSLNNIAALYFDRGEFKTAEKLYLQSLGIKREDQTIHNLAALYNAMGRLAEAKPLFHEALEIRRVDPGEKSSDFAQTLNCLAVIYFRMADHGQAEALFWKVLKIRGRVLGRMHPDYARTVNNLGAVYSTVGEMDKAERFYQRALEIRRKVFGKMHGECAQTLDNLGSVHGSRGQFKTALSEFSEAIEIRRRLFPSNHPDVAASLHNSAALHASMGSFNEAEPLYREALEIRRRALYPQHPDIAQSLYNLARLCAATDRVHEAFNLMRQASAIDDQMISQVFSITSENQRLSYLQELRGRLDGILSLIMGHMKECREAVQFGFNLVLRRKAILAEAMALQRDAVWKGKYPHLRLKLEALASLRQQIARATLEGPGREDAETHRRALSEWIVRKERLEIELARQIPDIALDARLRLADHKAVASALPEGAALIEYVRFHVYDFHAVPAKGQPRWLSPRYIAFFLPAGQADRAAMFEIGDADAVDLLIASFRKLTTGNANTRSVAGELQLRYSMFEDTSEPLWRALFRPLLQSLGICEHIFIAPDGDLALLPFEALLAEDGYRLIEKYHISYIGCGRDVLRFEDSSHQACAKALVAANPNFNLALSSKRFTPPSESPPHLGRLRNSDIEFGPLPGSEIEGRKIAGLLGVEAWLGDSVLECSLKNYRSPWILHIATHGFFLSRPGTQARSEENKFEGTDNSAPSVDRFRWRDSAGWENPLVWSGLALAGAETWRKGGALPEAAEDGILTAEDVSGLDLLGTELVVLSACDTGLGEVRIGEGVFGLRRAFLLAGAKTVVMTLWKVDDAVTAELMGNFYSRLLEGEGRAEALHHARLDLMRSHPAPRYWAAFICQGDPGPLRNR